MNDETPQGSAAPTSAASRLERMFHVVKFDHPDLVDGFVWTDHELDWINERITLVILAEREACAKACDEFVSETQSRFSNGAFCQAANAIRMRSNA